MSQLFAWGGQSIGVSASASVLPVNTQDRFPLGWTGWISLQSRGLSRVFSSYRLLLNTFPKLPECNCHLGHCLEKWKPKWRSGEESTCQFRRCKRCRFHPWVRTCLRGENGNLLQYSCLENPIDSHGGLQFWGLKELDTTEHSCVMLWKTHCYTPPPTALSQWIWIGTQGCIFSEVPTFIRCIVSKKKKSQVEFYDQANLRNYLNYCFASSAWKIWSFNHILNLMAEVCLVEVSQQSEKGSWIFKKMVVGTGVWKDN